VQIQNVPEGYRVTYQIKELDEYSLAWGYSGVIEYKIKKLPEGHDVTYQIEGLEE
jgi:hypothetical protein